MNDRQLGRGKRPAALFLAVGLAFAIGCAPPPPPAPTPTVQRPQRLPERTETSLSVTVKDATGQPLKDAVVYVLMPPAPTPARKHAAVTVANSAFQPQVMPIRRGTSLLFSNRDRVQYHIYSISKAKKFDVLLSKGATSGRILFDKPGVVVLGCAIHDQMIGYVYVLDTPVFAKTGDDGTVVLKGLPRRGTDVRVWHPRMADAAEATAQHVPFPQDGAAAVEFGLTLKK